MDLQKPLQDTPLFEKRLRRWIPEYIFNLLKFAEEQGLFKEDNNFLTEDQKSQLIWYFCNKEISFQDMAEKYGKNSSTSIKQEVNKTLALIISLVKGFISINSNIEAKLRAQKRYSMDLKGYRFKGFQIEYLSYIQQVANKIMGITDFREISEYFNENGLEGILNAYLKQYDLVAEDFYEAKKAFVNEAGIEDLPTQKKLETHLEEIIASEVRDSSDIEFCNLVKDKLLGNRYSVEKFYEYKAFINFTELKQLLANNTSHPVRIPLNNRIGFDKLFDYLVNNDIPCFSYITQDLQNGRKNRYYYFPASLYKNAEVIRVIE